jgi:hypothetical protein
MVCWDVGWGGGRQLGQQRFSRGDRGSCRYEYETSSVNASGSATANVMVVLGCTPRAQEQARLCHVLRLRLNMTLT